MIMCVLLCYPVSIRIYYQQGGRFLVKLGDYVLQYELVPMSSKSSWVYIGHNHKTPGNQGMI